MSLDAINNAIASAREAAAQAVVSAPSTAVAAASVQGGRAVSLREITSEKGMAVAAYLKVEKAGFLIGKDLKTYLDEITVSFRLNEAKPFYGLRYGNPAKYERSYDRIVNAKNRRSWADCVTEAQRLDAKCRGDYAAVDIPFTMVNTIMSKDGKTTLIEKDQKTGWTSSVTNWYAFQDFISPYLKLMDQGLLNEDALVTGKIVHEVRENSDNAWGSLTFVDFAVTDGAVTVN